MLEPTSTFPSSERGTDSRSSPFSTLRIEEVKVQDRKLTQSRAGLHLPPSLGRSQDPSKWDQVRGGKGERSNWSGVSLGWVEQDQR